VFQDFLVDDEVKVEPFVVEVELFVVTVDVLEDFKALAVLPVEDPDELVVVGKGLSVVQKLVTVEVEK
jgi:hypothetical protein